ncbi:MAG: hypothetical protein U9P10_09650 [Thermodesulfobacteriota bacterium]|nr:hypothetical protein [Thermodesulfobacteriota bacterium]
MPKRKGGLYDDIAEYENLYIAFDKASKGKKDRREVIGFREELDLNLMKIRQQLQSGVLDIGHYRFFRVFDPKPRNICAASFPERVLHHAVMNVCEPFLDNYLIYDSYACRKGKGNRKAVQRAQVFAQKFPWYLKSSPGETVDADLLTIGKIPPRPTGNQQRHGQKEDTPPGLVIHAGWRNEDSSGVLIRGLPGNVPTGPDDKMLLKNRKGAKYGSQILIGLSLFFQGV